MKTIKILCAALFIPLGIFLFIFGGYDDSPGAQLLGLVVVIITGACIFRIMRKQ